MPLMHAISREQLAERMHTHVNRLAGLIGPRHLGRPSSIQATIGYLERELAAQGETVEHHAYAVGDQQAVNLIVERQGTKQPDEIVIVGAHYDTVPSTPGADDNASAVAMLIEVARMTFCHRHERTIRFVSFACEEPPHFHTQEMGSDVYARRCRQRGEKIKGMLCLEMVGYYRDEPGSQQIPPGIPSIFRPLFPRRGNFIAAVGNLRSWRLCRQFRRGFKRASRFPLFSIVLPEAIHEIRFSDNSSFWDFGYPALMITDTSFLRNPHYHRPSDTPETLDYARMADVAFGVAGALSGLARPA